MLAILAGPGPVQKSDGILSLAPPQLQNQKVQGNCYTDRTILLIVNGRNVLVAVAVAAASVATATATDVATVHTNGFCFCHDDSDATSLMIRGTSA